MQQNQKNTLGGAAVKLTTSKVAVVLISLIVGMLLSRFRTLEEYGTYSQLMIVINLFTATIMLGLPSSLNYFLAKADSNKERAEFLSVYYSLNTLLSLLVGVVLVSVAPLLVVYFSNPMITSFMYFLAFFPWTKIIGSSIENLLIVYERADYIIIFRVANSLLILGVIILVQLMNWSFSAYMFLYLVVEVIFSIAVYIIAARLAHKLHFSIKWKLIKRIFNFSIPIGLATMVGTLNVELDKLMIGKFLDTEHLAIYTNASREMPVSIIASSITAVLLPQMVRMLKEENSKKAVRLWGNAIEISFTITCFVAAVLFTFAPEVMTVLYSKKYLPGVPVFRVYSLLLLLRFTYFGMILNSSGKTKFIFYSSLVMLGLNATLNYILFKIFGFIGPAIATFVSMITINLIQLKYTSKILNIAFTKIFPWKNLVHTLLKHAVIATTFYTIKIILPLNNLLCRVVNVDTNTGNICEAIVLGFLWVLLVFLLEYKFVKSNWNNLNSNATIIINH